jgi:hypothetical protein
MELNIHEKFNATLKEMMARKAPKDEIQKLIDDYRAQKDATVKSPESKTEVKKDDFVSSIPGLKEKLVKTQETKTSEVSNLPENVTEKSINRTRLGAVAGNSSTASTQFQKPYVDPITGKKNDSHLRLADGTPKDGSGDELMEFHMTETRDDAFWKKEKEKQQKQVAEQNYNQYPTYEPPSAKLDNTLNFITAGVYTTDYEKRKKVFANELHHEKIGTKQKLIDLYGTDDPYWIIANVTGTKNGMTLTNEDGTINHQLEGAPIKFSGNSVSSPYADGTYINPYNLPTFEDEDIMDYLYKPYMDDAQTLAMDLMNPIVGLFGGDTDYAKQGTDSKAFLHRFASENTDRSGIIKAINNKKSNYIKQEFDGKYNFDEGLNTVSYEWRDVTKLYGKDLETFNLFQQGKFDEAVKLNKGRGFETLYNKDGEFINWIDLSKEEKEDADPNNVYVRSIEDEEKAIILAERNKPFELTLQYIKTRHNLVAALKILQESKGRYGEAPGVGSFLGVAYNPDDFNAAISSAAESNSLIAGLQEASGDDEITKHYNEALKKFLILGRALELNQDLTKLAEEGQSTKADPNKMPTASSYILKNMYEFIAPPDEFAEYTADEQVEAFEGYMEEANIVMNDDWKRVTREGGDWLLPGGIETFGNEVEVRDVLETSRHFIKNIAPLVASLYIAKKLPIGFATTTVAGTRTITTTRTLGGQISKAFTGVGGAIKQTSLGRTRMGGLVTDLTIGGVEELVYFTLADQVGGSLFDMDPMIYNPKENTLDMSFAFGLGLGNVAAKKVIDKLTQTKLGSELLYRTSKYAVLEKAFERGIGATAGISSMEIAKVISGDSEVVKYLTDDTLSEEERNEMMSNWIKVMAGDWIGMFVLGYITPSSKIGEALSKDIQKFNIKYFNTSKDAKVLGIKENASATEVDAAVNAKKAEVTKEWLKSNRTEADVKKRESSLIEIQKAESNIIGRAHIVEAKKLISNDKKRLSELERLIYIFNKGGKPPSAQQMLDFGNMSKPEFDYLLKKVANPALREHIASEKEYYRSMTEYVKDFKKVSTRAEALELMSKSDKYFRKISELNALKNDPKGNNGAKIEIAKLELEVLKEEHVQELNKLTEKYKKAVALDIAVSKAEAKELGLPFEVAKSVESYEKVAGAKNTAAFIAEKNGKAFVLINPWQALKVRSIGTGIHEIAHHLTKDALKERGSDGKLKMTTEGIAIVNKFLSSLSEKDRKFVIKDVSERYLEGRTEWTESEKLEFYDENLTAYVEGLKNKDITLDLSSAQKIQNLFLPHLNKVFPDIGKMPIKKFSPKDGENIKDLLDNLYLESNRIGATSKYDLKIFMETNPKKVADAYDKFSNTSYSKFPEMERINKIAEQYTKEEWKEGKWEETYVEILPDIIKLLTSKAEKANLAFPGIIENPKLFAYEVANELSGMNLGQRNVGGHIKNFDITKRVIESGEGKFGLSGWINNVANEKMWNVMKKADKLRDPKNTQSLDSQEVKELAYEGPSTIEIIEREMSNEMAESRTLESDKLKVHEVMASVQKGYGEKAKSIHDGIREVFTKTNQLGQKVVDADKLAKFVSGKNMKSLPRLALKETVDLFVRDVSIKNPKTGEVKRYKAEDLVNSITNKIEKNKNLDTSEIIALQNGLDRWIPMIYEYVIPEGFITKQVNYKNKKGEVKSEQVPSATTGIPNKILAITHNKRSIAGVTTLDGTKVRTKENFFGQYKKPYTASIVNELREAIGIMKDGTRNTNSRKDLPIKGLEGVGETLKGVTSLVEKMITNQGVRDILYSEGKLFEAEMLAIADGKPSKSFAKSADKKSLEQLMSDSKEQLKTDFQINPDKTLQFINKITELYKKDQKAWEDFKLKNGYDLMTGLEEWLFTPETQAQVSNYTKLMFNVHDHILKMASKGGIVHEHSRIIVKDSSGKKIISKNGEKQFEIAETALKNFHPSVLLVTNLMAKLGFKSLTFDGRTLPFSLKGVNLKEVKSELTVKQIKKLEKNFKDLGIDIEAAVKESVDMVAKSPEVKKAINAIYKNNKTVSEKFKEVDIDAIEKFNNGNQNLLKLLTESHRLNNENGITGPEYTFNSKRLQTNIIYGERATSWLSLIYAVNGKQVANAYGTSRQMPHESIKKGFEGTLQEYYDSKEFREYVEDWRGTAEWKERYDINIKDVTTKEAAKKNGINLESQAEMQTIQDLSPFNEHINGNGNAMIATNNYILNSRGSNAKLQAELHEIAMNHATLIAPNYIAKKFLDYYGPTTSSKGYARLKLYLDPLKQKNIYTLNGESWEVRLPTDRNYKKIVEASGKEIAKTIGTVISNYSKIKGRDPLKDLITIAKATNLGKISNKEPKGMTTWDFDGVLGTTKSGVRATIPNPSGEPKPNRKVIFMAGGAGSGKGNVIKKLNLEQQGFKVVNSDISLEWLKKNNGLPENMNDFTPEQRSLLGSLQHQARGIAKNKMMKYKGSADGVVVDGTGGSIKAMEKLVKEFKDNGYDVSMMFVETSLETALTRNATRAERSLLDVIVRKNHESVQGNKEGFKEMFGDRFMEIKTDKMTQADAMPAELINKMNDFVSSYEKVRLDAEQFANEGKSVLDRGGKFDFTEFDVVIDGAKGPMFQTALNRAKKFGTKDQFVLTARSPEAAIPIREFLKSQGLDIPLENITGLGNSTGEAKALWMLEKFAEGYNDMYFADDAPQNVKAVRDVLSQLDIKSEVVQVKSLNDIKDVNKLDNPDVYSNIQYSRSHRAEYERTISKLRPDLVKEGSVSKMVDEMFSFIDNLKVPDSKKRKYEQITTKWLATGNVRIKEDAFRIKRAMELADRYKENVFSYRNPNEIIEKYAGKVKVKPTVPRSTKEFTLLNDAPLKERGVEEVMIADSRSGQAQARKIVNRHWGNESNPWCLTQVKDGKLTEDAWTMWTSYDKGPKHLVFHDGKLIAFKADNVYWDRMNHRTEGVIINVKEGRVTHRTELTRESTTKSSGVEVKGAIEPVIRETRTVSEDGNTVKTEIFENSKDGYTEGTVLIENRTKGVRTKETRFDPKTLFSTNSTNLYYTKANVQEFDKAGKPTTSYEFSPDGKIKSVNGHLQKQAINEAGLDVNAREDVVVNLADNLVKKVGDILEKNYTEKDAETGVVTDYFHGRVSLDGKVIEIGFESKSNLDIADVMKIVDGKTRIDINKVLKVDPTLKGLPKDFKTIETDAMSDVINQLDIKSEVQQSRSFARSRLSKSFNDIIEQTTKIESEKVFSDAQAKIRGAKKRYDSIIPASVQDLGGLLYNFLGKGKVGEKQMEFFKENLIDPFSKGINELNKSRQATSNDYNNLLKSFPDVKSKLNKSIEGGDFTYDQAIRVHLWNKAGFEIPGLSKRDLNALDSVVKNNPELQAFADLISAISKKEAGYSKPSEHWLVENLTSELLSGEAVSQSRSEFLSEWKQNSSEIFSKENLNKIQATYGNKFREALEDILYRMENGTNRPTGSSRLTNNFMNWINNSTGAIMFFNMRSALLQTLSTTNYINWAENNPLKAAAAFANQKQYWKDFSELFNSDFLKQRRSGNQRSINEAELSAAVANSDSKPKAALAWLLQKGFLPTQIADSFAIASGGSTFYRNRINKYIKEGMSPEQAREKAFLDFQEITEATQQSARPDMISQQQASPLGRLILSFQNTPMQYARIMNKAARDLAAGRGDAKHNISKIVYYGALQSIIFAAMQSAIFASLGDDEEEEFDKKKERIMYSMVDGWLAGLGVTGKAVGTIEKSIREYLKQDDRGFNADHAQTIIQLLGFSPPIGSKVRKIYGAIQTERFNEGVSEKRGLTLDNPTWSSWGNVIEGFTNIPLGRIANKMLNIDNALDSQNEWWERAALLLGWNTWDLGIKDPDITAVKGEIKEERKVEKKKEDVIKKEEKKQEVKEENISKEKANIELQKKEIEDGNKSPDCAAINKRGERCGTKIEKGSTYCTIHAKVEQSDGGKKTQCGKTKENGKRCKMQTSSKSGYCYYHD